MEANPSLQAPQFSSCTMPFIMVTDWPYNMGEVLAQLANIVHTFIREKNVTDDTATLVVATPAGLGLTPFHHVLLSPYSRYPVVSLDELSARQPPGAHVPWSAEGTHVSCFERAVLCKIHGVKSIAPLARAVLAKLLAEQKLQPPDPLGFAPQPGAALPPLATDTTLRVVLEARMGATRSIRNLHQVVQECEAANRRGFNVGSFNRLSCRILHTGDTPQLHGVNRFYANLAAVRSAHVLVAVHGAGAANCFFLEEADGRTALMEIRPCTFGTTHCGWPDAYMNSQLSWAGNRIRFFAYNVEDPEQCHPSDYEALAKADPTAPMRGNEAMRARDQHLTLKPGPFVEMLRHVGSLLRNETAYKEAQASNSLHGYAIPGGLRLAPLCAKNVSRTNPPGGRFIQVQ
ncbi:hypothetical protein HYH02_011424 [Chlamydomonas schloesseri]|uniref:Glycosyltransferase n=1 Tax=Chlamydomonas schloesseri TaxID=2026947 RepID=A0A835W1D7_9CHLO|nr:hypothetical protein HYH02_011424 [Chlamydomonas schloesseri]|eukprot:KAG2436992.1 hypothetical protein HYH02_011424 [Chlamydomonas schloesseri]